jgi:spermidine synthase
MYHVISTGIAATVLYLISYFFYRNGFYSQQDHRKLWNLVLAIAFLLAGTAGIFLALQINYKWNIPFIKTVLKWHVECGIGLAFAGIFHFFWHLSYFRNIFSKSGNEEINKDQIQRTSRQNTINLLFIGFVSSSVQLLMMREMMNIAGGYELITGTFLGSWLIVSAIGAVMARNSRINDIRKVNLVLAIIPLVSLFLMIILSRLFLNTGETPSFLLSIIYTLIVLLPFCFVSGYAFVRILNFTRSSNNFSSGRSFSIETTGGIAAGIAISVLTSGLLNTYQLLLMIILIFLTWVLNSFYLRKKRMKIFSGITAGVIGLIILFSNPDIFFRQLLLHGIKVKSSEDTSYGNITTAEYGGERSIYYNQRLLTWQNDEIEREENIHYAMLQHDKPEKVLIISGDIKSHLPEALKYRVKKVYYVERDPALIRTGSFASGYQNDRLIIESNDAYRFIKKTKENFDVIILLLPPPSTLMLNRYYTTEFFSEIKKKLDGKGVFMCSPGTGENYYNKESTILYSSVFNSLASAFRNVIPIVGNKLYYVASDGELSSSICSLSNKRGITNIYVNSDFLSDDLLNRKSKEVISIINPAIRQNSSEFPVACFHYQSYNLSKNLNERIPSIILMILIFAIPVFTIRKKNLIMYSSAAALAGFEIIMLLTLQSAVGNMYQLTGLIIAGLMTGLAVGSGLNLSVTKAGSFRINAICLILFYILTGLIFNKLLNAENYFLIICLILILTFIPALFTGQLFRKLTQRNDVFSGPSAVYSADLAGSALGFIFISGLAIPALGVRITIFLLSALIFAALLLGTIRNKMP